MEGRGEYEIITLDGVEFRYVKPYIQYYATRSKKSWEGMRILDMLISEFKSYNDEYYREGILNGMLQINYQKVELDYVLKSGDMVTHIAKRVEPPVYNRPIEIIYESPNLLVLNKPSSLPVHPSGAYYKNSLLYILNNELGYKNLHLTHRLDKVTSGLIIISKNLETALTLRSFFQSNLIEKYYIARVKGNFPYQSIEIQEKISSEQDQNGVFKVTQNGKDSLTVVKKLFYDQQKDESAVECRPVTGRTHQIRVHLGYLGFPIVDDISYGGNCARPLGVSEDLYRMKFGEKRVRLEIPKQLEIKLCAFRYKIAGKLDFSIALPLWALRSI
ncbi:hypothetical protein SteCoe_25208 [Stentor coeruleus]|uniref:Pseudouridine synthase n=1 Tax=Stentor coeruleus TaxID=5963 RepID=A0A1R2BFQ6_9CILI|nr:hypothetical protein SteCoe_25208 [Stentor coeruleus]